jgi:hypothetical protein
VARAIKALHREFETLDEGYALRERNEAYTREFNGKNAARRAENTIAWDENSETAET